MTHIANKYRTKNQQEHFLQHLDSKEDSTFLKMLLKTIKILFCLKEKNKQTKALIKITRPLVI